jgi:uncharacterized protein YqfA (UPF0365 family)
MNQLVLSLAFAVSMLGITACSNSDFTSPKVEGELTIKQAEGAEGAATKTIITPVESDQVKKEVVVEDGKKEEDKKVEDVLEAKESEEDKKVEEVLEKPVVAESEVPMPTGNIKCRNGSFIAAADLFGKMNSCLGR